jgi:hypothetical protein
MSPSRFTRKPALSAPPPVPPPRRNGERLRLGLTGLGAIFLIVMVVAAGLRPASRPTDPATQGESLAVLGVAPGAGPTVPAPPPPAGR